MSDKIDKKKFKDTKLGSWLKNKAPHLLNQVAEFIPESGYMGLIKNGIQLLTPELKEEGLKEVDKMDRKLTEIDLHNAKIDLERTKAILSDKENARATEVKRKKPSILMMGLGFGLLACYIGLLISLIFLDIPTENKDQLIHIEGIMEGGLLAMVSYYFGSEEKQN